MDFFRELSRAEKGGVSMSVVLPQSKWTVHVSICPAVLTSVFFVIVTGMFFILPQRVGAATVGTGEVGNIAYQGGSDGCQNGDNRACAWSAAPGPSGNMFCGVWKGGGNGNNDMHPLLCNWAIGGVTGGSLFVVDPPMSGTGSCGSGVLIGIQKWGNDGQLDKGLCQGIDLPAGWSWGGVTEVTIPSTFGQNVYCPDYSVANGFRYESGKDDAWRYLKCVTLNPPVNPPTVTNVTISPNPVNANGVTTYTISVAATDLNGWTDIRQAIAAINLEGTYAGQYRGLFGWSDSPLVFPYWWGVGMYTTPIPAGSGACAVNTGPYGDEYINLLGCGTSQGSNSNERI